MPLQRPTLNEIIQRIRADVRSGLGINTILRRTFIGVFSRALAGQSHTLHGNLDFVSKQLFPNQAEDEFLLQWASVYGLEQTPAQKAELQIKITGAQGSVISDQTQWQNDSGALYTQQGEATIPAPVTGVAEQSRIETVADVNNSLAGKYLFLYAPTGSFLIYFRTSGNGSAPNITGFTQIQCDVQTNDTANDVAAALQAIIDSATEFGATVNDNEVIITNADVGAVENITDVNTGFSVQVLVSGVDEVLVEALVNVIAEESGEAGNVANGEFLSLLSPVAGVDSQAAVNATITEGEDIESIEELRTRLLLRIQAPPIRGNVDDYIQRALEVPGVTRAWVFPDVNGLNTGSVGVTFVEDNENPIIPDSAKVAEVDDYLNARDWKPVTAEVVTFAPTALNLDMVVKLKPNTQAVRQAAEESLADLIFRDANPRGAFSGPETTFDGVVLLSRIREAISNAAGEEDHEIVTINGSAPANVVPTNNGELVQLGTITWQTLV